MNFKQRVQAAMDAKGMTQADVCRASGISTQLLSKIMVGKTENPRLDTLVRLSAALGVDYNYLLGWDDNAD